MGKRRKTTMYIDADVLRAAKVAAAREDKAEYVVVEDALRKHLGLELLERIKAKATMREDEAMELAVKEARRARREAGREKRSRS